MSNISPFEQFFNAFSNINAEDIDGGMEMLMDAVILSLRNLAPLQVELDNKIGAQEQALSPKGWFRD